MKVADNTVRSVVDLYRHRLGIRYTSGEVRAIIRTVFADRLGWDHSQVDIPAAVPLSESELLQVYQPLDRLAQGEPVQYVLGRTTFHGHVIAVDPRVLIPRPETEEMVARIMASGATPSRVLDIGTGSGCIAIALASAYPRAEVVAMDVDEDAVALAAANARAAGVQVTFFIGDALVGDLPKGPYDLVVSNPPYIPRNAVGSVAPDVLAHEPHRALFVPAEDPLVFHRRIATFAREALSSHGHLWLEMHHDQGGDVTGLVHSAGFTEANVIKDMNGHDRFLHARRSSTRE